jgi:hypothetical protein
MLTPVVQPRFRGGPPNCRRLDTWTSWPTFLMIKLSRVQAQASASNAMSVLL